MKTNFLLTSLVIVLFSLTVNSQITKGNWMVGGEGVIRGYKFSNEDKYTFNAELFPKSGYFILDKLAVGGEIGVFIDRGNLYSSFVPFSRYYLLNEEKIVIPYVEAGIGLY